MAVGQGDACQRPSATLATPARSRQVGENLADIFLKGLGGFLRVAKVVYLGYPGVIKVAVRLPCLTASHAQTTSATNMPVNVDGRKSPSITAVKNCCCDSFKISKIVYLYYFF